MCTKKVTFHLVPFNLLDRNVQFAVGLDADNHLVYLVLDYEQIDAFIADLAR